MKVNFFKRLVQSNNELFSTQPDKNSRVKHVKYVLILQKKSFNKT